MGIVKPKQTDLSSLVDSRIGVPDYNPAIMNVSSCVNAGGVNAYTSFSGASSTGFSAVSDGSGSHRAGTADELSVVAGKKYLIEFDLALNSGAAPSYNLYSSLVGLPKAVESTLDAVAGHNSKVVTATETTTCVILFVSGTELANYTISNLSVNEWSGEELVGDNSVGFVANDVSKWASLTNNIAEQDGNAVKVTYVDDGTFYVRLRTTEGTVYSNLTNGQKYRVTFKVKINTGYANARVYDGSGYGDEIYINNTDYEVFSLDTTIIDGTGVFFNILDLTSGEIIWIEIISVMKVTGLVAAYNMIPSPEGVLVDISGEGNNGMITGGIISDEDNLYANGVDGRATFPSDLSLIPHSGQLTITARLKEDDSAGSNNSFIGKLTQAYSLVEISSANALTIESDTNEDIASCVFPRDKQWHDIVISCNKGIVSMYIDGVSQLVTGSLSDDLTIDRLFTARNLAPFRGNIDDIKFFNYAFSEAEAIAYHNSFQKLEKKNVFSDHPVGSTI